MLCPSGRVVLRAGEIGITQRCHHLCSNSDALRSSVLPTCVVCFVLQVLVCLMLVMPRADVLMGFHKTFHFKCYLSFTLNIKFLETLKKKKKSMRENYCICLKFWKLFLAKQFKERISLIRGIFLHPRGGHSVLIGTQASLKSFLILPELGERVWRQRCKSEISLVYLHVSGDVCNSFSWLKPVDSWVGNVLP